MSKNRGFHNFPHLGGIRQDVFASEKDSVSQGGVHQMDFLAGFQNLLSTDREGRKAINQMSKFQYREVIGNRDGTGAQRVGAGFDGKNAARMETDVNKKLFQIRNVSKAKEHGHVAFQYPLHDVFSK